MESLKEAYGDDRQKMSEADDLYKEGQSRGRLLPYAAADAGIPLLSTGCFWKV